MRKTAGFAKKLSQIEDLNFGFAVAGQALEVADDIVHTADHHEAVGILHHHGSQVVHLRAVHDADENAFVAVGVHTLGGHQGGSVVKFVNQVVTQFLRVVGDDFAANGAPTLLRNAVTDGAGSKAVENAKKNRFQLEIVDKVGAAGHKGIQSKNSPEEIDLRLVLMDEGSHKIRAAQAGPGLENQTGTGTGNNTGNQRAQNGAVGGRIHKRRQIHMVQKQNESGEGQTVYHGADSHGLTHQEKYKKCQRNVNQDIQISDADAENMLNHGADTVQTCRGETVGKHEQLIGCGRQHCNQHNGYVRHELLHNKAYPL